MKACPKCGGQAYKVVTCGPNSRTPGKQIAACAAGCKGGWMGEPPTNDAGSNQSSFQQPQPQTQWHQPPNQRGPLPYHYLPGVMNVHQADPPSPLYQPPPPQPAPAPVLAPMLAPPQRTPTPPPARPPPPDSAAALLQSRDTWKPSSLEEQMLQMRHQLNNVQAQITELLSLVLAKRNNPHPEMPVAKRRYQHEVHTQPDLTSTRGEQHMDDDDEEQFAFEP